MYVCVASRHHTKRVCVCVCGGDASGMPQKFRGPAIKETPEEKDYDWNLNFDIDIYFSRNISIALYRKEQ